MQESSPLNARCSVISLSSDYPRIQVQEVRVCGSVVDPCPCVVYRNSRHRRKPKKRRKQRRKRRLVASSAGQLRPTPFRKVKTSPRSRKRKEKYSLSLPSFHVCKIVSERSGQRKQRWWFFFLARGRGTASTQDVLVGKLAGGSLCEEGLGLGPNGGTNSC